MYCVLFLTDMKLYIDTSNSEKIIVDIDGNKTEHDTKVGRAQMLLEVVTSEINKKGMNLKDLKEIEVNLGPGSFTGLRVGVSVANALSFALNIPVNGKHEQVIPTY